MADEEFDGTYVVRQFLGERQRVAHQTRNALSQGVVEALEVIGFPGFLRDGFVSSHRNHALIGVILIRMKRGLFPVYQRELGPQLFGTVATAIPPMTSATPASCAIDGRSPSSTMLSPTVITGWTSRMSDVTIAGSTFNVFSAIAVIMLMGLVVKNAILLVDFFNQARQRGIAVPEALLEAGSIRLRPILMTTLAMVFGMMPLALALGLVVVPVVLVYIDRLGLWTKKSFSRSADELASRHKPAE